jgi:predicted nuclease of predicted toxin-antitoxin system
MPIPFYMDEHIPKAITLGLRLRGVDVLTAQEDGQEGKSDPELLDRACALRRVVFTFDDDLLSEAAKRQREGKAFCGVIYAHPLNISIGKCISDLHVIGQAGEPEDMENRVEFLPLRKQ